MTKRILIIDDEPAIRHAVDRYLTRAGFDVQCARELEEAEALLAHVPYDLVIVDLSLSGHPSGTEGLELVRFVRRHRPSTRVIVLTAHGSPWVEKEARRRGCDALVHKPKPLSELARLAMELIGSAA